LKLSIIDIPPATQAAHGNPSSNVTVLLADASWFGRMRGAAALRRAGAHVVTATRLAQARHHLELDRVDIALLDLDGHGNGSSDILKLLQSDRPEVYTVALSAAVNDVELEALFAKGFDDFLAKPLDVDRLRVLIDTAIDARRDDVGRRFVSLGSDSDFHSPDLLPQLLAHLRDETDTLYTLLSASTLTRRQLGRRMHRVRSGLLLVGLRALADECLDLERDCELAHVEDTVLHRRGWRIARQMRALSAVQKQSHASSIVESPYAR